MILHSPRERPESWKARYDRVKHRWALPFIAFEWIWAWTAFGLSNWRFLEVLEYLSSFSVLVVVIFYFSESGDRVKQRHYQAWQVINTAQGKGGSGGRIEALQELNEDKVPLIGVDVSLAFLKGLKLEHARLARADFHAADVRDADLQGADFSDADLHSANLRNANLMNASLVDADITNVDLEGSSLEGANFEGADLEGADLSMADLRNIRWQKIKSIDSANLAGVKNAPEGFIAWALKQGAAERDDGTN
jgi:Pentapeptide repeats (8 copies)